MSLAKNPWLLRACHTTDTSRQNCRDGRYYKFCPRCLPWKSNAVPAIPPYLFCVCRTQSETHTQLSIWRKPENCHNSAAYAPHTPTVAVFARAGICRAARRAAHVAIQRDNCHHSGLIYVICGLITCTPRSTLGSTVSDKYIGYNFTIYRIHSKHKLRNTLLHYHIVGQQPWTSRSHPFASVAKRYKL